MGENGHGRPVGRLLAEEMKGEILVAGAVNRRHLPRWRTKI